MTNKKIIFSKRKFLAATLAAMMAMSITVTASADVVETTTDNSDQTEVQTEPTNVLPVYSPEFPDAYILPNETMGMSISDSTIQTVSATVFVEEEYGFDNSGNPITISSRLLSQDEVLEIGLESFGNMEGARQDAMDRLLQTRAATNGRGALSISFDGYYSVSGNKVTCDLSGNASWNVTDPWWSYKGESNPGAGSDYMGITWSGGYTGSNETISASSLSELLKPPVLTMCDSVPNAGRVWEFSEVWSEGEHVLGTLKDVDVGIKLTKNQMENNGNTAEAVLKYIHTYQNAHGSISITASSSGVGGGFVLTNVDKQWSLVCTLTGFPC